MANPLPDTGFLLGRRPAAAADRAPVGFGRRAALSGAPDAGQVIADVGEGHAMVLAPTGAGKKRNVLGPTLLTARNPCIVLDVKGELARETAAHRRDVLGHDVHVLDPWGVSGLPAGGFNPIDVIRLLDIDPADQAYSMAGLLYATPFDKDPFWNQSAQAVISGAICHLATSERETDRSFRRVYQLLSGDDLIYNLAVLLDTACPNAYAKTQLANLVALTAEQTRQGVIVTMNHHLRLFGSEAVQTAMGHTSFDLQQIRDGAPVTIYVCVPVNKLESHAALLRIWLGSLMDLILSRTRLPPLPTLMLLDELGQLGRMDQVMQAVTLARGYGMRCMLLLQGLASLKKAYPQDSELLIENCASLITFGHSNPKMSQQVADCLGDISADALFDLAPGQAALRRAGRKTEIVDRLDYLNDTEFAGQAAFNPMARPTEPRGPADVIPFHAKTLAAPTPAPGTLDQPRMAAPGVSEG